MAWRRTSRAILAGVMVLAALTGCGGEPPPTTPAGPLRILLVNANGWTSPGIVTLKAALERAGNDVWQISPLTDRSSSGTAMTAAPATQVAGPPSGNVKLWATTGTATDAMLVGLRAMMGRQPPDLVIVGIDPRPNVSLNAVHSGTVGAAMTAAELGFPSVAVSASTRDPVRPQPAEFAKSSAFVVRLVETLSRHPAGSPILPLHTVLNVNYPSGTPRRVVGTTTADTAAETISFRTGPRPGTVVAVTKPGESTHSDDDVNELAGGDVTLSDLGADPDRTAPPPRTAVRLAPTLTP